MAKGPRRLQTTTRANKELSDRIKEFRASIVWPINYHVCNVPTDLGRIAKEISKHRSFSFDVESSGLNQRKDKVYCVSIYVGGHGYLVNLEHPMIPKISKHDFISTLGSYFKDPSVKRIGFNITFDTLFLWEDLKVDSGPMFFDGSIASWLIDENIKDKALKPLCERWLGIPGDQYEKMFGKKAWIVIDPLVASYYAIKDAELHYKLYEYEQKQLDKMPKVKQLMYDLEMPTANVYLRTEREGLIVDEGYLKNELGPRMTDTLEEIQAQLQMAGLPSEVDVNSPEQLSEFLFRELELPDIGEGSTAKGVLNAIIDEHPIVPLILEYRETFKLKTAFVDALSYLIHNGRLYPQFKIIGSDTGRLSARNPNIMQMPAKAGPIIRRAFIAPKDYYLVSMDYSGQELRLMAAMAKDAALLRIVNNDADFYAEVASIFFNMKASDLKKGMPERDKGKVAVLALNYGAGEFRMSKIFECPTARAKKFIEDYNNRFHGLHTWQELQKKLARKQGFVETVLGRRRRIIYHRGLTPGQVGALDRVAMNSPIQGSASDQVKLAFVTTNQYCEEQKLKSYPLLTIHDEALYLCHKDEWHNTSIKDDLAYIMSHVIELPGVSFPISTEVYERWGEPIAA